MNRFSLSLILVVVLGAISGARGQEKQITARDIVADIQKHVGVEWDKNTVDTFKAGNPNAAVTGIAVNHDGDHGCSGTYFKQGTKFHHHP